MVEKYDLHNLEFIEVSKTPEKTLLAKGRFGDDHHTYIFLVEERGRVLGKSGGEWLELTQRTSELIRAKVQATYRKIYLYNC